MRLIFLSLITLAGCTPRLSNDFIDADQYDRSINRYPDLVENQMVCSIQLGFRSDERLVFGSRFTMKMELIRLSDEDSLDYPVRFVLRSSPEEWPIADVAYLFIDDRKIPLHLQQVNPRNTQQISGMAMDGSVSISTTELQVYRIESQIPAGELESIKPSSNLVLVFHSGNYPVTFRLTESDVSKILALRTVDIS